MTVEEAKLPFVPLFPFPSTSPVLQVMLKGDYTAGLRRPQRNENVHFEKLTVSCIACPLSWKESTGRSSSLHTGSPYGQALAYLSLPVSQFRVSAVFLPMLWTSTPWGCPRGVPEYHLHHPPGVCHSLFTFQFWRELAWPAHTRAF